MTATHKNFLKTTISAVASSGLGAFTISTASSGYRTFGSGDDGKTFDGVTIKEGTAWEVRDGCVYTHSGTSLSRGTLQDSSTGSAIAFTSAAVVQQGDSAGLAGRIEQVALVRATGGDSSITLAPNTHYTWDLSTLTADRTGTLPTTAAVGDAIEISAITGNASYELLLSTGSGQTCALGSIVVAASTEITRLLMAGESMRFVYEASNVWAVAQDGRVPSYATGYPNDISTNSAATATVAPLVNAISDSGGMLDTTTNFRIDIRRAGNYEVNVSMRGLNAPSAAQAQNVYAYKNGAALLSMQIRTASTSVEQCAVAKDFPLAVGDYIQLYFLHTQVNLGVRGSSQVTWCGVTEIL